MTGLAGSAVTGQPHFRRCRVDWGANAVCQTRVEGKRDMETESVQGAHGSPVTGREQGKHR